MVLTCNDCGKVYRHKPSLRRHRQTVHGVTQSLPDFQCSECAYHSNQLSSLYQHFRTVHDRDLRKVCHYCGLVFGSNNSFAAHVNSQHGMPLWSANSQPTISANEPIQTACSNTLKVFKVNAEDAGGDQMDLMEFLMLHKNQIFQIVQENVQQYPQKIQIVIEVALEKVSHLEDNEFITVFLRSSMVPVYISGIELETFIDMAEQIISTLHTFTAHGSGWSVVRINHLELRLVKLSPIRGSSYLALPTELANSRSLLNIRNHSDNNCFIYCYIAAWHLKFGPDLYQRATKSARGRERVNVQTYQSPAVHKPKGDFSMPMPLSELARFERLNKCKINVFRHEGKQLIPIRVSKQNQMDLVVDLLLLTDGSNHHYVLIKDLTALIKYLTKGNRQTAGRSSNPGAELCRNCFYFCYSADVLQRHQEHCFNYDSAVIKMPTEKGKHLKFKNFPAQYFAPVVIYFDSESILRKVRTCARPPGVKSTEILEKHDPCGVCFAVIEHENSTPLELNLRRSPQCMEWFLKELERLARKLYYEKRKYQYFAGTPPIPADQADICWICEQAFTDESIKVLDHCHYKGTFLGWAHQECNVNRRVLNFTPVLAHNLSGYDMHHVCQALTVLDSTTKITVIPTNTDRYISLGISVLVNTYIDREGKEREARETMRLVDSFQFMASSLEKLVSNLPNDKLSLIDSYFSASSENARKLLKQKGFYCYSYVDEEDVFEEPELPPLHKWGNTLAGGKVQMSEENLEHAKQVFRAFECTTIGEYHDLYLKTDVLLLAAVFEAFRKVCYQTYGLDAAQFFSAPNLSGSAALKICRPDVHLLTAREHLDLTEKLMRGGVASVFAERLFTANNHYLENYNPQAESTFGIMLDANNLYGGIMEKFALPTKDYEMFEDYDLEEILHASDNSSIGYIVEVDLTYPDCLHNMHADFPLAPIQQVVNKYWLSDYQTKLADKLHLSKVKTKKLLQTLYKRSNYVVHYLTLQLYVNLGMKVEKLHRVLKFGQHRWLAPYISLNTRKRMEATNTFDINFYKLMSNSCYGKMCESKRNRVNVVLVKDANHVLRQSEKTTMKSFIIFSEDMAAILNKPSRILWDKPTITGAVVLDLAKRHMFDFHYNVMKVNFNCSLLYSDTDSLTYKVSTHDLYQQLASNKNILHHFDFSNYDCGHQLYNNENNKVTLKFKDEMGGKVIKEFVGLKPKMYSILVADEQKKSAKGITKFAQRQLTHQKYRDVLLQSSVVRTINYRIQSEAHVLLTVASNKLSLTNFDDKRYILENGIQTLPYGHYEIRERAVEREIVEDDEWGEEDEEEVVVHAEETTSYTGVLQLPPSPPDPGLHQPEWRDSDFDDDLVDFDAEWEEEEEMRNSYLDDEAMSESETAESQE